MIKCYLTDYFKYFKILKRVNSNTKKRRKSHIKRLKSQEKRDFFKTKRKKKSGFRGIFQKIE